MINAVVSSIVKEKRPCYFISPHFDDAILSAGALMSYLSKHTKITVINVFTKAGPPPYTLSARTFLSQCGYTDAEKLFVDREKEDAQVLSTVANTVINLNNADALWRKARNTWFGSVLPEIDARYPTYRFHAVRGVIARSDQAMVKRIIADVRERIKEKDAVVFAPLGIGNHIDHVITRKVAEAQDQQLIYWSDFPYNDRHNIKADQFKSFTFDEQLDRKKMLIKGYKTQYNAMFHDSLTVKPEAFYYK